MNKPLLIVASALVAVCAFAQESDKPACAPECRPPKKQFQGMSPNAGMWIPKMLSNKEVLSRIGVTDEAVAEKIAAELSALEARGGEIERKIRDLSHEQAKLFRSLIKDNDADPKPVTDLIDQIAELRAEQGRIAVEAMIALRNNLTKEQIKSAFELVRERGAERRRERMEAGGEPPFAMPRKPRDGHRGLDKHRHVHPRHDRDGKSGDVPPPPPPDGEEVAPVDAK